jgi:hypothetical protein
MSGDLSAYNGKRLRFWTTNKDGDVRRVGVLSVYRDAVRLEWEEDVSNQAKETCFAKLPGAVVSMFERMPENSEADFDLNEVLGVRSPLP